MLTIKQWLNNKKDMSIISHLQLGTAPKTSSKSENLCSSKNEKRVQRKDAYKKIRPRNKMSVTQIFNYR